MVFDLDVLGDHITIAIFIYIGSFTGKLFFQMDLKVCRYEHDRKIYQTHGSIRFCIDVFRPWTEREGQLKQCLNFGKMFWYLRCSCTHQISLEMSCCLSFSNTLTLSVSLCAFVFMSLLFISLYVSDSGPLSLCVWPTFPLSAFWFPPLKQSYSKGVWT